jgi:Cu/Ag efflux protein CusF
MKIAGITFVAVSIGAFAACHRASEFKGPAAAVQTTAYHARGVVKRIDPQRPSIELDHEEIPGLMPAMTMEFYVDNAGLLNGLKPGDRIDFTIENSVGGLKITGITKRESLSPTPAGAT